jgi:hypothetical protein
MKTTLKCCLALTLFCLTLTATAVRADEWDKFNGKWTAKKSNDEGRSWTQVIEINKGKFKFRILSTSGESRLYAEGDVKLEKHGPFNALKFHNIKAGESVESIESVDEERTVIYQLSYDTLTVAADFDKERETPPSADKYTKSK